MSVVVPALNNADTIGALLDSLVAQSYSAAWEVIVADNGSSDATVATTEQWTGRLPDLRVVPCGERQSTAHALNAGTRAARAQLVAYCNADDVVSPDWLSAIVPVLDDHELATGPIDLAKLNPYRLYSWRRASGFQETPRWMGYLQPVIGCNMAVRRETFDSVGGFDLAMHDCQDFDFAWRVQLAGGTVGFARDAVVHWRLRQGWWPYLQRSIVYGANHVDLYCRFRHLGMRRRLLRGVLRTAGVFASAPLLLVPSYRYGWLTLAGTQFGRLKGSVAARTLFL